MPLKDLLFEFESRPQPMPDGTTWIPLTESRRRWVSRQGNARAMRRVVYELETADYALVEELNDSRLVAQWIKDYDAVPLLREFGVELPPNLQRLFDTDEWQQRGMPIRDLSYWAGKGLLNTTYPMGVNHITTWGAVREIVDAGVGYIQLNRGEHEGTREAQNAVRGRLRRALFSQYPVHPDQWWGSRDRVPPARVSIFDLQWPEGTEEMQATLRQLHDDIEPLMVCLLGRGYPGPSSAAPTVLEQKLARAELQRSVPTLERLVMRLRLQLDDLEGGETFRRLQETQNVGLPRPEALLAFVLYETTSARQRDIAEMITAASGETPAQGNISRWIGEVREWLGAGNKLPPQDPYVLMRAISFKPSVLDLGKRRDGRTPRQRAAADEE